ncbi:glycosyl hydrolase family 7 protein [Xylariaceae sp. FL1019]|nr:glycosyl hydrolase family 7 protein [Xylariaceae sp. FL1019]
MYTEIAAIAALVASVRAQQVCTLTTETKPALTWYSCDSSYEDCTSNAASVTIDANWRWVHDVEGSTNCYSGNVWDESICSTDEECATACCVDGASYQSTYGVSTSTDALTLQFVTSNSNGKNVGSRLYLMADDATTYEGFTLLGKEFSFDVDVSELPCGLNGALYFVSMPLDGQSGSGNNTAGAEYGTGYCDSQCPRDLKFIDGLANIEGWEPQSNSANSGVGDHGACCPEMDVWEANSISAAYTAHPCENTELFMCDGDDCGGTYSGTENRYSGECDPDGCDFNSYRMGDTTFYGPGMTVDTNSKFTVVTQFIEEGGALASINRFYIQDGEVIANSESAVPDVTGNSLTEEYCDAEHEAFGGTYSFSDHGGWAGFSDAISQPMVLVMSIWDDYADSMLWLDSTYAGNQTYGLARGTCPTDSGVPAEVEADSPNSKVTYSNIRFGAINSTWSATGSSSGSSPGTGTGTTTTTSAVSTATGTVSAYGQCGGIGYAGATACASGYTCKVNNEYYSQCLP